jgi:ubiquinone/menaquinone biosynthesis C-methylase UbiE
MKNNIIRILLFLIITLVIACKPNQEKPGGFQGVEQKEADGNNMFDDLVADFESKDRLIWQKPEMIINRLGEISNQTVVDLGAGTGFFAFRMVRALPPAKKVIALDIDQRFITFMDSAKQEMPADMRARFETRLVDTDNPKLKNNEADAVVIVNTYMYIQNRVDYMKLLKKGIAKGGKVLIVEYKEKDIPVGPPVSIKVPLSMVEKELKTAGFTQIKSDDTSLDYQYIVTAISE